MIYLFVAYYNGDTAEFKASLAKLRGVTVIRRKRDGIYWTRACNDFRKELRRYRGVKPDDVVCLMNNDISFEPELFEEGGKVLPGQVLTAEYMTVDWSKKKFYQGDRIDSFPGRTFFITVGDFLKHRFSSLLPHYLSDVEYSIRLIRKGITPRLMKNKIVHREHTRGSRKFSILNPANPIFWSIFLFKSCPLRYLPINLIKAWAYLIKKN